MKVFLLSLLFILGFSFSACSKTPKANNTDNGYYDRANKASKESLRGLDRDIK